MKKIKAKRTRKGKDTKKHKQETLRDYTKKTHAEEIEELMFQRLKEMTKRKK
jgi:hypothetical protein